MLNRREVNERSQRSYEFLFQMKPHEVTQGSRICSLNQLWLCVKARGSDGNEISFPRSPQ